MIVVDASALVDLVASRSRDATLTARLRSSSLHAPFVVDIEVANGLRRLVAGRALTADRAADALDDFRELRLHRYPHLPLLDRVWELRGRLSAYDASYVALAELLEAPLVTCDSRLERAGGHNAAVEVFAGAG